MPLRNGLRLPVDVPPGGPLFEGHFPGRPILPGVGLLDLALRALTAAGASPTLRDIATLRLRRLVEPGERLEIEVQACDLDGRVRFEVRRAAEVVANGVMVLGEPSSEGRPAAPRSQPRRPPVVPDLDDLLPHRPPMRFVEAIEAETDGGVVCAARVPALCAFIERGSAPALVALEMAAQSAAVFEALRRFPKEDGGGARVGYLVGARNVRFARARVPAGAMMFAAVRLASIAPPLSIYDFEVADATGVVASGTLSAWLTARGA
jgi:3-hydroxymyristoyl/3-hydroxydecanoyl-(acyl carrier protein) dehydratase